MANKPKRPTITASKPQPKPVQPPPHEHTAPPPNPGAVPSQSIHAAPPPEPRTMQETFDLMEAQNEKLQKEIDRLNWYKVEYRKLYELVVLGDARQVDSNLYLHFFTRALGNPACPYEQREHKQCIEWAHERARRAVIETLKYFNVKSPLEHEQDKEF